MAAFVNLLRRTAAALVSRPVVYDVVQVLAGSRKCYGRLKRQLPGTAGKRVLDVGGGTGRALDVLEANARYTCLDMDRQKLVRLREKYPGAEVVVGDAAAMPTSSGGFELALCVFVAHHLQDSVLRGALGELSRVCRGSTLIMEPLWVPSRAISRLLWRYDQGAYPRTRAALLEEVERYFEIEHVDEWTVFHRYILLRCRPRRSP